jgi:hypothetical protein
MRLVPLEQTSTSAGATRRIGEGGYHLRLRGLHWRRPQTAFPAVDQADAMELRDRHPWRVGSGTIPLVQRYRSGMEHNRGGEFDAPFARIDRMGPDRFDIYWMRRTGKWWRLHVGVTLAEALRILETDGVLHPV